MVGRALKKLMFPYAEAVNLPRIGKAMIGIGMCLGALPYEAASERPPNLVVILFDTLRADHTGPYSSTAALTPTIDRLASEGVTFTNAYSTSSYTRTAVASLFTSTHPWTHGCVTKKTALRDDLAYLPEVLHRSGYRTLGLTANPHDSAFFGFGRGFDEFYLMKSAKGRNGARNKGPESFAHWIWSNYVGEFLARDSGRPFFIYLHEIDPHSPYTPPEPYDTYFDSGEGVKAASDNAILQQITASSDRAVRPEEIKYWNAMYRGEIAYMDEYLDHILARFEALGHADNTVLVFLSDHGDEFFEHKGMYHWRTLYDEVLRVPLIVRFPDGRGAGSRVDQNVSLIDVAPTILNALGLSPVPDFVGRGLIEQLDEKVAPNRTYPVFARVQPELTTEPLRDAVIDGHWKLIRSSPDGESDAFELYNLASDPGERRNLWTVESQKAIELTRLLDGAGARAKPEIDAPEVAPKSELEEQLRALGYVE